MNEDVDIRIAVKRSDISSEVNGTLVSDNMNQSDCTGSKNKLETS
jgi:hypothetical protein